MKKYLFLLLLVAGAVGVLSLRFSGRVRPAEMTPLGRALVWAAAFFLSFGPLTIAAFKLLRETWGYDASLLSITLYGAAAALSGLVAWRIGRWVAES